MVSRSELRQIRALVPDHGVRQETVGTAAFWTALILQMTLFVRPVFLEMRIIFGTSTSLSRALTMGLRGRGNRSGLPPWSLIRLPAENLRPPFSLRKCDCQLRVVDVGMVYDAKNPAVACDKVARGKQKFLVQMPAACPQGNRAEYFLCEAKGGSMGVR